VEITYLYCLGNVHQFEKVIEVGDQFLLFLDQNQNIFANKNEFLEFKASTLSYMGFGYLNKKVSDIPKSLSHFSYAVKIFEQLPNNTGRYEFQRNVFTKIGAVYLHKTK
jgi:hypothetical protein